MITWFLKVSYMTVTLTINGQRVTAADGSTILEAARE